MSGRRQPRKLSAEDEALWRRVAATVAPIGSKAEAPVKEAPAVGANEDAPIAKTKKKPSAAPKTHAVVRPASAKKRPAPDPRPQLDRRLVKRLGRGAAGVDAVIDLHGLTQREAHDRLIAFLTAAHASGRRVVLVVTGKGRREESADWWAEGTRGILRRAVPQWLATPPLRGLVVGYERAHERRGGEGAIYVQLRRDRPTRGSEE